MDISDKSKIWTLINDPRFKLSPEEKNRLNSIFKNQLLRMKGGDLNAGKKSKSVKKRSS